MASGRLDLTGAEAVDQGDGEIAEGSAITVDLADGQFVFQTTQPETVPTLEPVAA